MTTRRRRAIAIAGGVLLAAAVALIALTGGGHDEANEPAATAGGSRSPSPTVDPEYQRLTQGSPGDLARSMLVERVARAGAVPSPSPDSTRLLAGAAEKVAAATRGFAFTIGSFNVLGSQHTAPGGDARGFASGTTRAGWAADLIGERGLSVVGFQEMQADQLAVVDRDLGEVGFWPGLSLGAAGVPQNVMWDERVWQPTYTGQLTIPFVGTVRPQPIVRLRNLDTGREIYVLNVHNSPNGRQSERDQALAIEVAAVAQLRADGLPVFLLGDFNERDRAFCAVTGGTDLLAAAGGTPGTDGPDGAGCLPPASSRIDWIFASPDTTLSDYRVDDSAAVRRVTDHAVITAEASVD